MIKASIFNAVNFSDDFNRESEHFDPWLQRAKNFLSSSVAGEVFLSFKYTPAVMPETAPAGLLALYSDSGFFDTIASARVVELDDCLIYFFDPVSLIDSDNGFLLFSIIGVNDVLYSEKVNFVIASELSEKGIVKIQAYNNDETQGYISEDYPAAGFFKFSKFSCYLFGNEKTEYNYSYGKKMILDSEIFIKTRLTFVGLSMYQQNLLKILCNCQNLLINGVGYCLVSDFTEKNKSEENEICDLQAEFVEIDQEFFKAGSPAVASDLRIRNLFMK